jgi:hypothetical protein
MVYGMNPRAVKTSTFGCARVGLSSETTLSSASKDHETPSELTPFQRSC